MSHAPPPIQIRRVVYLAALLLLLLALLPAAAPRPAQSAFPGTNGKIAFVRGWDLYTMEADGSHPTLLVAGQNSPNNLPSWSPDGSRLAFIHWENNVSYVHVIQADGSNEARIGEGTSPTWSPDGSRIAYLCGSICIVRATDGGGLARVPLTIFAYSLAWSPDGTRFLLAGGNVYVVEVDGSGLVQLTDEATANWSADWSPDGSRIVYEHRGAQYEIVVMDADGSNPTVIAGSVDQLAQPAWSPDGTTIVFMRWIDGNNELYRMNADGSAPVRLTNDFNPDMEPDWQPLPGTVPDVAVRDLDTLGGADSEAWAINEAGQATGWARLAGATSHAFRWSEDEGMADLGSLGGNSRGRHINARGDVAGESTLQPQLYSWQPFFWSEATGMLCACLPGMREGYVQGLNDQGQLLGWARFSFVDERAYLWTLDGGPVELGSLGGTFTSGIDLNNAGQVIGVAGDPQDRGIPFLWSADTGIVPFQPLGPDVAYQLRDLNDRGQIAGDYSRSGSPAHPFLWSPDTGWLDLGTLGGAGGYAYYVNEAGQVLGQAQNAAGRWRPFLWSAEGGMVDLGGRYFWPHDLGDGGLAVGQSSYGTRWTTIHAQAATAATGLVDLGALYQPGVSSALDANGRGQIAGYSDIAGGSRHAVVWTVNNLAEPGRTMQAEVQRLQAEGVLNAARVAELRKKIDPLAHSLWEGDGVAVCNRLPSLISMIEVYQARGVLPGDSGDLLHSTAVTLNETLCSRPAVQAAAAANADLQETQLYLPLVAGR